jgi:hypothetical protein
MEEAARVECYSGSRYGERPLSFLAAHRRYVVKEVEESWRTTAGLHFRVRTDDDEVYELAYDEQADQWHVLAVTKIEKEYP